MNSITSVERRCLNLSQFVCAYYKWHVFSTNLYQVARREGVGRGYNTLSLN